MQAGSSTFAFRFGKVFRCAITGGRIILPLFHSTRKMGPYKYGTILYALGYHQPQHSCHEEMTKSRAAGFLSQFESDFGKQRVDPKDKEAKTVMNSILKAGTLQCLMTSMSILEVLGFCQVLFRPFLKVTIQTTIKKRPERPSSIFGAKPHFLPKTVTIPIKAVEPNSR